MRVLIMLLALMVSLGAKAAVEYELSYVMVKQDLFGKISFPMNAYTTGFAYTTDSGFGARVTYGSSTETANSLHVEDRFYTNKINSMWNGSVYYRHSFDKTAVEVGYGRTGYKTTWTENGEEPAWGSNDTDSDASYYARVYYQIEPSIHAFLGYHQVYEKYKQGYGDEQTTAYQAGVRLDF